MSSTDAEANAMDKDPPPKYSDIGKGDESEDQTGAAARRIPDYIPTESAIDISTEKDGLLFKEITKAGEGDDCVPRGAKVSVHYIGRLIDGTEFDRSSSPFKFDLGEGKVIKGWDVGIATMKKGEEATLIIDYSYAYGEKGSGKIPAFATLFFDVTVLEWEDEDLSPGKNGAILRKRITDGLLKYIKPNEGATVDVELEGTFEDRVFDKRYVSFELGEGSEVNICEGIEIALNNFARGDTAMLTIKPEFGFGPEGNTHFHIPPNATVVYKVFLKNFKKLTDLWNLSGPEKLEYSQGFKDKGTKYFKEEKYSLAVAQYKKMVDYLKAEALLKGEEEERRKSLLCASYLNQSICWLKLKSYVTAHNCAESALELEPNNTKAHFRKGMAYLMTKDYEIAIGDFQKVLELDPENKAAQQQLNIARRKNKEQEEATKELYTKMFKYNCEKNEALFVRNTKFKQLTGKEMS